MCIVILYFLKVLRTELEQLRQQHVELTHQHTEATVRMRACVQTLQQQLEAVESCNVSLQSSVLELLQAERPLPHVCDECALLLSKPHAASGAACPMCALRKPAVFALPRCVVRYSLLPVIAVVVTKACARRPGTAVSVEHRRRER
jgi:hypothetical protein